MRIKSIGFVLILVLFASLAFARTAAINEGSVSGRYPLVPLTDDPTNDYQYHDVGKVWITVTNWGFIGNPDPDNLLTYPSAMYPGGSNIDFLFQGAVWFGAVIGKNSTNPDTLVTVGIDGWAGDSEEMFPGTQPWDTLFVRGLEQNGGAGMKGVDDDRDWDSEIDDINGDGEADVDWDGQYLDANGDGNPEYDPEGHFYSAVESPGAHTPLDYSYEYWNNSDYIFLSAFDEDPKGDPYRRRPGASYDPSYDWTAPYDDDQDGIDDEDGEAISEQDFIGIYSDIHDVPRSELHPLGIKVTQKSYAWSYSYSDDYMLVDYTIENAGGLSPGPNVDENGCYSLEDCWLGMYIDGDIGPNWNTIYEGVSQDDITGFIMENPDFEATDGPQNLFLGYIFDGPNNAGGSGDDAIWDGFLGTRIIDTYQMVQNANNQYVRKEDVDIDHLSFSFNWWISEDTDPNDETPVAEGTKYSRMSNLQDDYYACPNTDEANYRAYVEGGNGGTIGTATDTDVTNWPQPTIGTAEARGITSLPPPGSQTRLDPPGTEDTRFLVSYGPFTKLAPGEQLHITVGMIMGLNFRHLLTNAYWAKTVYDNHYRGPTPPPSPTLTARPYGNKLVRLDWNNKPEKVVDPVSSQLDFEGYRIYRSRREVTDSFEMIAEFDMISDGSSGDTRFEAHLPGDSNVLPCQYAGRYSVNNEDGTVDTMYYYIDKDVTENYTYYYSVTSFDRGEPEPLESSINSNMISIIPSQPAGGKSIPLDCDPEPVPSEEYSLDDIMVVPNPYRGDAGYDSIEESFWEDKNAGGRDKKLVFSALPDGEVTIRIYTLAGDLVQTLNETLTKYGESVIVWNMLTRSQQRIVSGVYIYSVESNYGTKIGKFAVIK